jgi:uncharacterized membrane protein (DUF373 family)
MRKISIYLILGGSILLCLKFVSIIFTFLSDHPIIGLGIFIIVLGVILFLYDIYQENQKNKESEPFRGVKK